MRRLRVWVIPALCLGAHAMALAASASTPAAGLAELVSRACGTGGASAAEPAPLDAMDLRRQDAPAAQRQACGRLTGPDLAAQLPALTDLAWALVVQSAFDPAQALLAALEPLSANDARAAAEVHAALGTLAHDQNRPADAAPLFEQARVDLRRAQAAGSRLSALVLVGLANAWRELRGPQALENADAALTESATLLEGLGLATSLDMADVLNARTVLAYSQQDLEGTVRFARAEVDVYRRLGQGDHAELLDAYSSLGAVLSQLNRFAEAEAALKDALRIGEVNPEASPQARLGVMTNLAMLHLDRGQYPAALAVTEQALAFGEQAFGADSPMMLTALNGHALALFQMTRLADAQREFERARALSRAQAAQLGPVRRVRLQENLTGLYLLLNDIDAAQDAIDEGLRIVGDDKQLGYWRGRLLRHRAAMAARAGDWVQADALQAQAAPLIAVANGERHAYVELSNAARCVAQVRGALPGSACADLESHLDLFTATGAGTRYQALQALAQAAQAQGRFDIARSRYLQALAAAQATGAAYPLWAAMDALAVHLRTAGERSLAVSFGKQAVQQIEQVRAGFLGPARAADVGFVADKHAVYRRVADWLTEDSRIDEALEVLRLLKEDELADFVRRDGRMARGGEAATLELTPAEARWRDEWRPASEPGAPPPDEPALARRWDEWLSAFAARPGRSAATAAQAPGPSRAPSASVPALTAWIFPGPSHVNLVIEAGGRREVHRLDIDPAELAREVGRTLSAISLREPALPLLQSLYQRVALPIDLAARRASVRRLVLHLDGAIRYLPFAALHDGHAYLGERYAIERRVAGGAAPQTLANAGARQRWYGRAARVAAFGVTRAMSGMAALPAVAEEVCGIVAGPVQGLLASEGDCAVMQRGTGVMNGQAWMNDQFTVAQLRDVVSTPAVRLASAAAPERRLLHIGTHFQLRPGHIGKSWLLMGDGQRLTLDELAAIDMPDEDLVTLSACETGLGGAADPDGGREVDSLAALIMRRGARAVVASLWRVEDRSTSLLMRTVYAEIRRGADPADALQRAQRTVRQRAGGDKAHPYFWAGFYLSDVAR